ncbi:FAD-binding dehydrogenase [Naasia aerilata]|uniref:FAD-binding dehydrogenase n=1 Tax=Naasia aerilata TaxID=1162966 RepID=A0ABN6XQN6_9MICO|nr:FAD-binding dehydrogenase [Naasia aerilata]BDZ46488.1 FAD-binding dehydrogenase [Naasia aerilata]
MADEADALIVGAGLAGLVAAAELLDAGKRVILVDQEPEASLGGQAWWSFGGLFLIDTPEQRRLGVRDSLDLATQDWFASAGFDRDDDRWPRRWAEAYLDFAAGEKRGWLHAKGVRWFPVVGWAERGGQTALAHGNSVPRFHVTWGTGPGVVAPFERRVRAGIESGHARLLSRHRADALLLDGDTVVGVRGRTLAPSPAERGAPSSREETGDFELRASAVVLTTGGIGGDHDLVRRFWPDRMAAAPTSMLSGVPASVDGRGLEIAQRAGARLINGDRMWHYTEGIANHSPVWSRHGIRILPGPSSLWLDSTGRRLPAPLFPGFDTLATLEHLTRGGHDHSWFVLTQRIIEKEFALSGSEQNPDLTGKDLRLVAGRVRKGAAPPVQAFLDQGADFVSAPDLSTLLDRMEALSGGALDRRQAEREVLARDREVDNKFSKDAQITAIRGARRYAGDRLIRVAPLHRLLDPKAGPLHAVKLHVLTRKSLGGIETDLSGRALGTDGEVVPGLWAAGEVSGFGGGGMHGYRSLEGTFLGGCLFSGRVAGRSVARSV